jgi:hypothetical protein
MVCPLPRRCPPKAQNLFHGPPVITGKLGQDYADRARGFSPISRRQARPWQATSPPLEERLRSPPKSENDAVDSARACTHKSVLTGLPPKADMCGAARDVRYGPKADMDISDQRRNVALLFRRDKQVRHPLPHLRTECTLRPLATRDVKSEPHWTFW